MGEQEKWISIQQLDDKVKSQSALRIGSQNSSGGAADPMNISKNQIMAIDATHKRSPEVQREKALSQGNF